MKSLSKSGNTKKDQGLSSLPPLGKESSSVPSSSLLADTEDVNDQPQESKVMDTNKRVADKESSLCYPSNEVNKPSNLPSNYAFSSRDESAVTSNGLEKEKEKLDIKNTFVGSTTHKMHSAQSSENLADMEEKVQKVSPPRRKAYKEEKPEKIANWATRKDIANSDLSATSHKQQTISTSNSNHVGSRRYEAAEPLPREDSINEILEVGSSELF